MYEKVVFRFTTRSSWSLVFCALEMARRKRPMYHSSEYWYMGSMDARSAMQKKRLLTWNATGW